MFINKLNKSKKAKVGYRYFIDSDGITYYYRFEKSIKNDLILSMFVELKDNDGFIGYKYFITIGKTVEECFTKIMSDNIKGQHKLFAIPHIYIPIALTEIDMFSDYINGNIMLHYYENKLDDVGRDTIHFLLNNGFKIYSGSNIDSDFYILAKGRNFES